MDLRHKHITWVESIFEKLEDVCQEVNDIVSQVSSILFALSIKSSLSLSVLINLTYHKIGIFFSVSLDIVGQPCL